ncbi:MAG TPA: GNAT family N-acetyltransferase [Candidatus Elarobacter sp.]|nr:GNAT family N-acetyltransferase [Candidatus Elarobacter sp.]
MHHLWSHSDYEISTDPTRVDIRMVYEFLTNAYWAKEIPVETVRRSIENSICFGVYHGRQQVGFARIISDRATFAYLADVFILPAYRGRGLSRWLMECIVGHPDLQGLRRWMLVTQDAHGLYAKFGFTAIKNSEPWMEIHRADVYARNDKQTGSKK